MDPAVEKQPVAGEKATTSRGVKLLLAALLLLSLGLRLWSASDRLNNRRHFDERFTLRNVAVILVHGGWRPANAFYGSLSYLPQTAAMALVEGAHRVSGREGLSIFDPKAADGWSTSGYWAARSMSVLFGVLGIWATFLLGRRLHGPWTGLLAAALVAALPAHVVSSALIKPDVLVALLVTLTFLWSLSAVAKPSPRTFALAGVGIGLAVAAKYTGVGVAIPLVVGALAMEKPAGWSRWRPLWLLLVAALASLATFLILHPHMALVVEYLPRLWSIMETKGEASGGSHWTVFALEGRYLLRHHRWPVLLLAIFGVLMAARQGLSKRAPRGVRVRSWMMLSYFFGYSALYAAATKLFKGQNYLPVTAFTAVFAAAAALALWRWLAAALVSARKGATSRPGPLVGPALIGISWSLPLLALFQFPLSTTYHQVVPSTWSQAGRFLIGQLQPASQRYLYFERAEERLALASGGHRLVTVPVASMEEVDSEELDLSDAALFKAKRLEGESADRYLAMAARPSYRSRRFEPRWFRAHGPEIAVLLHGWQPLAQPLPLTLEEAPGRHRYRVDLPEPLGAGEVISLRVRMPIDRGVKRPSQVRVNGHSLTLFETKSTPRKAHQTTSRLRVTERTERLVLTFEKRLKIPWTPEVDLHRWHRE